MIDIAFLREVQKRGWSIEAAGTNECVVSCPANGCGARFKLRLGGHIPPRLPEVGALGAVINSLADFVELVIRRRKTLRLSREEIEQSACLADGHVRKIEDGVRIPNIETSINLAKTLGYSLVLVPTGMPDITLRSIAGSRDKEPSRARRFSRPARKLQPRRQQPKP